MCDKGDLLQPFSSAASCEQAAKTLVKVIASGSTDDCLIFLKRLSSSKSFPSVIYPEIITSQETGVVFGINLKMFSADSTFPHLKYRSMSELLIKYQAVFYCILYIHEQTFPLVVVLNVNMVLPQQSCIIILFISIVGTILLSSLMSNEQNFVTAQARTSS